jgi:hypothetical protein
MNTSLLFFYLLLLISEENNSLPGPHGLMVEFIREPAQTRILDARPEFSWIVPDNTTFQKGYQIIVSSGKELAAADNGDMWDSGMISGTKSTEIEYKGKDLSDSSAYFWKVRTWNIKGKPSAWSEIQCFKTGRLRNYGTTPNRFQVETANPEKLIRTGSNHYFADFGKDAFGKLILLVVPPEKDTLTIHLGEKTAGLNKIDTSPGGTIRYHRMLLPVEPGKTEYTPDIPADPRNTGTSAVHLPDSFGIITPFRYCEIENCGFELNRENIIRKSYSYYFEDDDSHFECSDTILNRIWQICKYSIKATSFAGLYVDGDRERIPYEADAYINQLGHYYTDREYSMARLTNEYFIDHPTWPTEWILITVPLFYNDFMFTGNDESLKEFYYRLCSKTLIEAERPDGLISADNITDQIKQKIGFRDTKERIRDIVDWPPAQKDTGWKLANENGERDGYDMVKINTVVNAFYYHNLVLMSEIAGTLGKTEDSVMFRNRALKVRETINLKLFDKQKGIYLDGEFSGHSSLHANMMALAFGLVPDEYKKSVIDFIKSRGMACSVYGAQFLLEGLYKAGEQDYALSLMTDINDRSWWNMIRSGSTITLEAWDMKYKPNSDWNHAWGAAPANILPGYMWGIRPSGPGFSKVIIRPQPGNLTWCRIVTPTIKGPIKAEFKGSGNRKEYLITIPANMECDFIPGIVNELTVILNGKTQRIENGIIRLLPGINRLLIEN